eukprot:jgi/Tetstr1/447463/TSEL_003720.t1
MRSVKPWFATARTIIADSGFASVKLATGCAEHGLFVIGNAKSGAAGFPKAWLLTQWPEPPPAPRGPPLRYYLTTVSADRSSNVSDGVKLNGPLTTARLREASSTANQAAQGVYVFTSLAEAQDETDLGFDAAYPAASEFCQKCGKSTTVDGLPVVGEEALVSAVTEAMYDRMNGHGHHMELPTGYSVGPSDPKAWPFLTAFDDPKVYAMRELHALCEAHFVHPMDDSDALRDVMGWDSAHKSRHRFP